MQPSLSTTAHGSSTQTTRISYDEATRQAVQLRKQGATYPEIAEHLARIGYRSPKTKAPLKEMAVRLMVTAVEKREAEEAAAVERERAKEAPMYVVPDSRSFRDRIRTLATLSGFTPEQRLTLITALMEDSRGTTAVTPAAKAGATKGEN